MKIVVGDAEDALQHLVQIKGGKHSLPCIVQDSNFVHNPETITGNVQTYRNVAEVLAKVPKVTRNRGRGNLNCLLPLSRRADPPVSHHAEPEVYDEAPIHLERTVPRQMEGGSKKEVRHVAQDDGAQSLDKT